MAGDRLGFPTHKQAINFFADMPSKHRIALLRQLQNARDNQKRAVPFNIDPHTGQLGFRFNKGGVVLKSRRKQCKYF